MQDQPPSLPHLVFDHIAVAARTLEEGVDHVRNALGVDMPPGGAHPRMGTHNRLLSLGPNQFLEVIAIDPDAPPPMRARWFALDAFDGSPRLAVWVLGTPDLSASLANAHPECGPPVEITRGDLSWQISVPQDGSLPLSGAFPTLIQWPDGPHPARRMVDLGCRLHSLTIRHPHAAVVTRYLDDHLQDKRIGAEIGRFELEAVIETPQGLRSLT